MTDPTQLPTADLSRRRILQIAIAGSGAIIAASLPTASFAASKVAKAAVAYQPQPKGKARCDNCVQWQASAACKLVAGDISPSGWCSIYFAKA